MYKIQAQHVIAFHIILPGSLHIYIYIHIRTALFERECHWFSQGTASAGSSATW